MQQPRNSYHFETHLQSAKSLLLRRCLGLLLFYIFLLTMALPNTSFAQVKCEALFKPTFTQNILGKINSINPFAKKQKLELSPEQVEELKEMMTSANLVKPYGLGRGEKENLFLLMLHELPESQKNLIATIIDHSPAEFGKYRNTLNEILTRHKMDHAHSQSFFDLLLNNYADHLKFSNSPQKFSEWLLSLDEAFNLRLKSGELNLHSLKAELQLGLQKRQAQDHWQSEFGVNQLPVSRDSNGTMLLTLKSGEQLKAVMINSTTLKIEVPKSMVGRAAWNPLYSEVLQAKISAGGKPPEVYDGFLATNGVFYLTDGNHRFAALETREKVWIKMSYPAKTASMSVSFDAIGLSQPSVEVLMDLFNGKLTLEDMVGGANATRIIYR
jgi:hypothetical protein